MLYTMEGLREKQNTCAQNKSTPISLTMHKNSQTIAKPKPKIRIIHIFAPEIIKTDVANFRELVQKLTGKPTTKDETNFCIKKKKPRIITSSSSSNKKMELAPIMKSGILFDAAEIKLRKDERIKGEEEIWKGANSGGGFLGGFAEIDGFMQELNNQFPFLESTTQMDVYGESQLTTC